MTDHQQIHLREATSLDPLVLGAISALVEAIEAAPSLLPNISWTDFAPRECTISAQECAVPYLSKTYSPPQACSDQWIVYETDDGNDLNNHLWSLPTLSRSECHPLAQEAESTTDCGCAAFNPATCPGGWGPASTSQGIFSVTDYCCPFPSATFLQRGPVYRNTSYLCVSETTLSSRTKTIWGEVALVTHESSRQIESNDPGPGQRATSGPAMTGPPTMSTPTMSTPTSKPASQSTSLTPRAKIGLAIGISIGSVASIIILVLYLLKKRHRLKISRERDTAAEQSPTWTMAEMSGQPASPKEVDAQHTGIYELAAEVPTKPEMDGTDRMNTIRELDATPELCSARSPTRGEN